MQERVEGVMGYLREPGVHGIPLQSFKFVEVHAFLGPMCPLQSNGRLMQAESDELVQGRE